MAKYKIRTLSYYSDDGTYTVFHKYYIDTNGVIKNKKSGRSQSYGKGRKYNTCGVLDNDGKRCRILVGRAVLSTFRGRPPTLAHTADHKKCKQTRNDKLTNLRWNDKPGQSKNQIRSETFKYAFIVVKNGVEKTVHEWVDFMNAAKESTEREYTRGMVKMYAQRKQRGFAYKEYPDLEDEVWKSVSGSETSRGHWEISDLRRVKQITKHAVHVLWGDRLSHNANGYPIFGNKQLCHVITFQTFFPELWAARKPGEKVLHEKDDKEDFRPHKLRLGTQSMNVKDAHDNGKYDGSKTERTKCASYVDGKFEKEHESQTTAAEYLKSKGCSKSKIKGIVTHIGMALSGDRKTAYGRTWANM
jgi:hypothetical protein